MLFTFANQATITFKINFNEPTYLCFYLQNLCMKLSFFSIFKLTSYKMFYFIKRRTNSFWIQLLAQHSNSIISANSFKYKELVCRGHHGHLSLKTILEILNLHNAINVYVKLCITLRSSYKYICQIQLSLNRTSLLFQLQENVPPLSNLM